MPDALLSVLAFLVVTLLFSFYSWKQKQKSWQGIVIDKKTDHRTDQDGFGRDVYRVIFKTDQGKKITFPVTSKAGLDMFEMGKQYLKKSGSYIPEKVN